MCLLSRISSHKNFSSNSKQSLDLQVWMYMGSSAICFEEITLLICIIVRFQQNMMRFPQEQYF